jgi:hypothetical protein
MSTPASSAAATPVRDPCYCPHVVIEDEGLPPSFWKVEPDFGKAQERYEAGEMLEELLRTWDAETRFVALSADTYYSEVVKCVEKWPLALLDQVIGTSLRAITISAGKHGSEEVTYDDVGIVLLTDKEAKAAVIFDARTGFFDLKGEPRFLGELGDTLNDSVYNVDENRDGFAMILSALASLDVAWPSGAALATEDGKEMLMPLSVATEKNLNCITGAPVFLALMRRFLGSAKREGNAVTYSLLPPIYDPRPPPAPSSAPSPSKRARV